MRNLLSTRRVSHRISSSEAPDLPLAATTWDAEADSIICAFGPSSEFPIIEIDRITANRAIKNVTSWNYQGPCPREGLEVDKILDLHHFGDDSSICLVLEGGDVILVREDPGAGQSQVEIVGSVEEGIKAASWSPDEGLLAIATAAETFILMTRQFEPVSDARLLEEDLELSKHVNVGWGKKETQFKGKRAAALRDPTIPEKVDEGVLSPSDAGSIRLSWRGDAQFVAISTIQSKRRRVIRVFSRNGELDGVNLQVPPDDVAGDERCRSVERGSKLVTVVPSTFAVVLQMPRGNLETIYPRALVLAGIRGSVDAVDYKTAFAYCRTHRVDLNILYDHSPQQFMVSIDTFLDQIENPQYVDLFLSMLRDEDVTKTMYDPKVHTSSKSTGSSGDTIVLRTIAEIPNKVNTICDAILAGIRRRSSPNTQNLVTCYVSKRPPDLDSGLSMISEMRTKDPEKADLAIEHISFLADVNKLYDHALGIYDLELALLIAQQSQKDPREYLPFLQSIRAMTQLRQKHYIDDFLGHYNKAASWLHDIGDNAFAELSEYTVKHDLYRQVTDLVKYDQEKRNIIIKLHAEYLITTSDYREAGLSFEQLGLWESALAAYQKCGMWQEALYAASRVPLSPEETTELAGVLADALVESKDFRNAARIYLDYHNDAKEAVSTYCKGSFFGEAMRVIALKQEFHLLDQIVDPGLVESFNTTLELIADFLEQIKSQISRIKELREKKQKDPLAFYGGSDDTDAPDNVSVAGTDMSTAAGSIFTRYTDKSGGTIGTSATRKTSKNRRREERKKARGKKGSVYEEEYLVNSIGRLITRLNETQAESYRLIEGLVRRGMRERAESIQLGMQKVLAALEQGRKEVFDSSPAAPLNPPTDHDYEGGAPHPIKPPDFSTIQQFKGLSII
ncbi:hypothetical protein Dda_0452 [Drechslerella dactyloides]|uniref:Elongator complex protein 1 n=1 Tax=Drechslerella dactyloides TaxID=74499 RepID=A0AAD6NN26_DREDA|nr:hypothetical protein Dda_0452 [Drechslerella dactyloides]